MSHDIVFGMIKFIKTEPDIELGGLYDSKEVPSF